MPGFPVLYYLPEFAQIHVLWVSDAISSSATLFSFCLQSFPASESFPMSRLFSNESALCYTRQSTDASASASVLPMSIQSWFPLGLTDLISLQSKGTLKSLLQPRNSKALILQCSAFFMVQLSHLYVTTRKTISLTIQTFVDKVMSLLFNVHLGLSQLFFQEASIF